MRSFDRPFIRFVITYLIVLLIPVAAFLVYFRVDLKSLIEQNADQQLERSVTNAALQLKAELDQMLAVTNLIQGMSSFMLLHTQDPTMVITAQGSLNGFVHSNDFVSEIAYYHIGSDRVYTSSSPLFLEAYVRRVFVGGQFTAGRATATEVIAGLPEGLVIAGSDVGPEWMRRVLFVQVIPTYGAHRRAILVFEINDLALRRVLSAGLPKYGLARGRAPAAISLLSGDVEFITIPGAKSGSAGADPINTRSYSDRQQVSVTIPEHEATVTVVLDRSIAYGNLDRRVSSLFFFVTGLLILCLPLVYAFAMTGVKPIARLRHFLSEVFRDASAAPDPVGLAERKITTLLSQVNRSSRFVCRELLRNVISGKTDDWPEFVESCRAHGAPIDCGGLVILIASENAVDADRIDMVSEQFLSAFEGIGSVVGFRELDAGDYVFLLALSATSETETANATPTPPSGLVAAATDLLLGLEHATSRRWSIAFSRSVRSEVQIPQAYIEAKSALEHRFVMGLSRLLPAESVLHRGEDAPVYPSEQMEQLGVAMERRDVTSIHEAIRAIFAAIQTVSPSLFLARCVTYNVVTTVLNALSRNGVGPEQTWRFADVSRLGEIKTVEEMQVLMYQLADDLVRLVDGQSRDEVPRSAFDQIRERIDARIYEPDLSAKGVSAQFGLSLSNFSHQFRRNVGTTFQSFLSSRRIARAKILLCDTDGNLSEIVSQVGYGDVSSFIKKFKAATGLTPIEYRRRRRMENLDPPVGL